MRSTEQPIQSDGIICYSELCRNVLTIPKKEFTLISRERTNVRENVLSERGIVL